MYYAQLDENNKVKAITESSVPVLGSNIIEIGSYDLSLMGAEYSGGEFVPAGIVNTIDFIGLIKTIGATKRKQLWAALSDEDVNDFVQMIQLNKTGTKNDEWVQNGIAAIVSAGIISQATADNLLE